jgi:hypothetical protein
VLVLSAVDVVLVAGGSLPFSQALWWRLDFGICLLAVTVSKRSFSPAL